MGCISTSSLEVCLKPMITRCHPLEVVFFRGGKGNRQSLNELVDHTKKASVVLNCFSDKNY